MKRIVSLVAVALVAGTMAYGQTNVLSQNAVGYVKVTIDAGDLALLRYDFEQIDGSASTLSNTVGDQVPSGSNAYMWDRSAKSWVLAAKGTRGWSPDAAVARGDAFFLQVAAGAAEPAYDVFLLGEVPGANNNADSTVVDNVEGDAVGFPYPAATALSAMDMATQAASGASVYLWDQVNQAWATPVTKGSRGWASDPTIEPGEGFFIVTAVGAPIDATEVKPYAWP